MIKAPQAMRETEQGSEMWRVRKVGGYKHNLDAVMERGGVERPGGKTGRAALQQGPKATWPTLPLPSLLSHTHRGSHSD